MAARSSEDNRPIGNVDVREAIEVLKGNLELLQDIDWVRQEFDNFKARLEELGAEPNRPSDWRERESETFRKILEAMGEGAGEAGVEDPAPPTPADSDADEREVDAVIGYLDRESSKLSFTAKEVQDWFFRGPGDGKARAVFRKIGERPQLKYVVIADQIVVRREELISQVCAEMGSQDQDYLRNTVPSDETKRLTSQRVLARYMLGEFGLPESTEYDKLLTQGIIDRMKYS